MLIPSVRHQAEWAWEFHNSDGSTADMCGNGARCFARFIQKLTHARGKTSFETGAGVISANFDGDKVSVNMTEPHNLRLHEVIQLRNGPIEVHSLNTGVPHAVVFTDDDNKAMVQSVGSEIRYHIHFAPKGTNVNFVQVRGPHSIRVRTYERGVEGETLACGTGVTASALITAELHKFSSPVQVQVQGGDTLEVRWEKGPNGFKNVTLKGPADFVFEGDVTL
jgi:diaminopimelate epimerase